MANLRDLKLARLVFLTSFLIPILLAFGSFAFWPAIRQEFDRRLWWENILAWSEDGVAAFWYLWFVAGYVVGRQREVNLTTTEDTAKEWRHVAVSMLLAAVVSCASIAHTYFAEKSGYKAGVTTIARGYCIKRKAFPDADHFKIVCHFIDRVGNPQEFWVIAVDDRKGGPAGYSPELMDALRRGSKEFPIPVRYNPSHPKIAWIDGSGGIDENGSFWMSLSLLFFQLLLLAFFALKFLPQLRAAALRGEVPWWASLYKVVPLAAEAVCVGLFGILELAMQRM